MEELIASNYNQMDVGTLHKFLNVACAECERVERLYDLPDVLRNKLERLKRGKGIVAPLMILGGVIGIIAIFRLSPYIRVYLVNVGILGFSVYGAICAALPYVVLYTYTKSKLKSAEKAANDSLANILPELSVYMQIPSEYRLFSAMQYMKVQIENGRANTWKECVDLFEEQVHRWRVEYNTALNAQYSAEAAAYARSAAHSASASAVLSGVNLAINILK
jgi:hypothetical protein